MRLFLWFSKTLLLIFLPFRTWTLICLASEFDGIHWKTPLWDLFTRWISSELTVTPGRQFWLKTSLTLAASFRSSPFAGWDSDTSTNWNNKKMDFFYIYKRRPATHEDVQILLPNSAGHCFVVTLRQKSYFCPKIELWRNIASHIIWILRQNSTIFLNFRF